MTERSAPSTPEEATVDDLLDELERLESVVDAPEEQRQVRRTRRLVQRIGHDRLFGQVITQFTRKDKAEAFVGSVVVGLPMLVEDGVLEIGAFLASTPLLLAANLVFAVVLVVGILYVAGFREVHITDPYFGVIPRRVVWVLGISFVTAAVLMTMWGRVTWDDPWVNLCQVSVVFTGMAIGASLGDILPGER